MRLIGVFKPFSTGEDGRGVMSFENIENKGRFIKNSNLGSSGSYKKCISLMETDRNCSKKNAKTLKREAGTVFQLVLSRLMKYAFL